MESAISLTDKILLVREIDIFSDLSVSELAAVASVTEAVSHPANQVVIREGDMGETMFLIVEGRVAVIKNLDADNEFELDHIDSGDYFGEMALFEDRKRSASIRTLSASEFLVLHKGQVFFQSNKTSICFTSNISQGDECDILLNFWLNAIDSILSISI